MNLDYTNIKAEIELGEDSSRQFKVQLTDANELAKDLCAFSNSFGGNIFVGINDANEVVGISKEQLAHYNQLISNAASNNIHPQVYPVTQTIKVDEKLVLIITVLKGIRKPYNTKKSNLYYVKVGSDKRVASTEELLRMFQESNMLYVDESPTEALLTENEKGNGINLAKFYSYYEKSRGSEFLQTGIPVEKALENMNLAGNGKFNFAGLLLFSNNPQFYKPYCIIRCVSYYNNLISDDTFIDKLDCIGTLDDQFKAAMNFLKNNLKHIQQQGSFNQNGSLEISEKALEEAVVNTLLHRDYSKNAVIRLFVFSDRVEIISLGSLPNHLTVEHILNGNSVIRNPIIVSHATKILPYSGIGSGIPRILQNHASTSFKDDKDGEQFTITMQRIGVD